VIAIVLIAAKSVEVGDKTLCKLKADGLAALIISSGLVLSEWTLREVPQRKSQAGGHTKLGGGLRP